MNFSQRMGLKPVSEFIQTSSITDELRNALWNTLYTFVFYQGRVWQYESEMRGTSYLFYFQFLNLPVNQHPEHPSQQLEDIRIRFFSFDWNEVYDFVEWLVNLDWISEEVETALNTALERHLSGYRLIEGTVTPITNAEEISSIQSALNHEALPGTTKHLEQAIALLSDREKPDYRNSIKESISAVESAFRKFTGSSKATLGDALKEFEKTHSFHPALREGLLKIYGYTSDEQGVRHAMQEEPNIQQEDAVFFLVMCSAFINYLKTKSIE